MSIRLATFFQTRETALIILSVWGVRPCPFKRAESHPLHRSRRLPMASMPVDPPVPVVPFKNCPIATSLGVLGRKCSLLIIRDIGWQRADRFNALLRTIPGLTPRMLALRLSELEDADMIRKVEEHNSHNLVRWALMKKGVNIIAVLMRLVAFGSRSFQERVCLRGQPRPLAQIYPENAG